MSSFLHASQQMASGECGKEERAGFQLQRTSLSF